MKILKSKQVYACGLFSVTEDEAADQESGFEIRRSVIRHKGSAVMMPVDENDQVLLVRQYRLPADQYLWELPAGKLDEGETPIEAAKRELIEETGYRAKQWTELVSFFPSPGYVEEKMTIFLATDLTEGEAQPMDDERIEKKWFSKEEFAEMIRTNKVMDAKTMLGYLYWGLLTGKR